MRWRLADDDADPQGSLLGVQDVVGLEPGTGRMSGLEFLPVASRRILNNVPPTSAMPFRWTINAYRGCSHACTYCFARPTHEYLGLDAGDDFDRKIVVKINAVERLRVELADPRWEHEHVAMGTNTDPVPTGRGQVPADPGDHHGAGPVRRRRSRSSPSRPWSPATSTCWPRRPRVRSTYA